MRYILLLLFVVACGVVGYPVAKANTYYALIAAFAAVFAGCALFLPKTYTYMPKLGVVISLTISVTLAPMIVGVWLAIGPLLFKTGG